MTITAVANDVINYKPGDKVLVNFMDANEIVVQDPILTEVTLQAPGGSVLQVIGAPMRKVEVPVEYYLKWEHDILCKLNEQ